MLCCSACRKFGPITGVNSFISTRNLSQLKLNRFLKHSGLTVTLSSHHLKINNLITLISKYSFNIVTGFFLSYPSSRSRLFSDTTINLKVAVVVKIFVDIKP